MMKQESQILMEEKSNQLPETLNANIFYLVREYHHKFNESKFNKIPDYPKFFFTISLIGAEVPSLKVNGKKVNLLWNLIGEMLERSLNQFPPEDKAWKKNTQNYFYNLNTPIFMALNQFVIRYTKDVIVPYFKMFEEYKKSGKTKSMNEGINMSLVWGKTQYG